MQELFLVHREPVNFYKVSVINKIAIKLLGIDERTILVQEIWLILPEATAIGVRLSHASRELSELGILLSNTWITCPMLGNNLGKLRTMPHSPLRLER